MTEQQNHVVLTGEDLTKTYGQGVNAVRALDRVNLDVKRGELVLIMGPSGSGKTTLLSVLGGLLQPSFGEVKVMSQRLSMLDESGLAKVRAKEIGFIFQAYNLLSALTVQDNIVFPVRLAGGNTAAARERANELMSRLGIWQRRHARPDQLSGGEKQRVAVARALINDPPIILADEPTGNLDSQRGLEVTMILHNISREDNRAVVIVSHDLRIEDVADRVLWLEDGKIRDRKRETHEWTRDPVCGMRVDQWRATATADHEGKKYSFCTESCRAKFVADPDLYITRG